MPRLLLSLANPVTFVDAQKVGVPEYRSRNIDDWWFAETLNQWQQGAGFKQIWQTSDNINIQLQTDAGIPILHIKRCNGSSASFAAMTQKQQNTYAPGLFIYETSVDLSALDDGTYFLVMYVGNLVLISEPLQVQAEWANSLLIEYSNRKFFQNIVFETGFAPYIRIDGLMRMKAPGSKDTMYEDQILDMVMLKSSPYRIWSLRVFQIPAWMIDKLNRIFGCSTIAIDGIEYAKNDDSKWSETERIYNDALKEYELELREKVRSAKEFDPENEGEMAMILNASSKGFGSVANGTIVTVLNVD